MSDIELQIIEEQRKCLKCGHVRQSGDVGPDYACPACDAVYAKLEALQKASAEAAESQRAESTKFERGLVSQERFDREQVAREAAEGPRYTAANAGYLLMILPFVVTQVAAVMLAYQMRRVGDDWLDDHFNWQIRTFWYLMGLSLLAGAALLVGTVSLMVFVLFQHRAPPQVVDSISPSIVVFSVVCALALITAVYRIGKGWYRLSQRESP